MVKKVTKAELIKRGNMLASDLKLEKEYLPDNLEAVYVQIEFYLNMVLTSLSLSEVLDKKSVNRVLLTYESVEEFLIELSKIES